MYALSNDCSHEKLQVETSVTLRPVATSKSYIRPVPSGCAGTSTMTILQFVLDGLYHLTCLSFCMVNQLDHNLLDMNRDSTMETQVRADQKNAEILSRHKADFPGLSAWSDDEAPEEERSDMSDEEYSEIEGNVEGEGATNSAQRPLFFDGLEFYLAVSQVRERTVRLVLALGMAKTLSTLRDQKQSESIAAIEQHYPDFTCLPTNEKTTGTDMHSPMDLLAALQLPSAIAIAQHHSPVKKPVSFRPKVDEESCVSPSSLLLRDPE